MNSPATAESMVTDLDVLMIEDSAPDAELALRRLTQGGFRCRHRIACTEPQLREALRERNPDLILSDFSLPGFDGLSALTIAHSVAPDIPFIFLSGTLGEDRAIEALRSGAVDYVLKSNPRRLVPAVRRALAEAELRKATRLAERRVVRLSSVLQMLSGINTAVVRINDRTALLKEACRLAHRVGGYSVATIVMIDATTRTGHTVARAGVPIHADGDAIFTIADSAQDDVSITGRVIRSGEAILCNDVETTTLPISGRDALLAVGVRAVAYLPLRVDGTAVGAFLFGASEAGLFGQEELKLLNEVAANLSFALQYLNKQDAAHFLAYFDSLTGMAKRSLFCERLDRMLKRGANRLPTLAISVFDVDHLSVINDSYGRHVGDRLLQCIADRLRSNSSDTERLAHLGGGTFVSVTALGSDPINELHALHGSITRLFDAPFSFDGQDIQVTVKCGFACFPDNGRVPDELVQNAEAALKEAKLSGEQYLHHRLEMNSALAERVRLETRLRTALQNNEFVLHYQPKLTLPSGAINGAEALLRWSDPEQGLVAPGVFLPVLESAGMMPAITAWALRQAAADCHKWRAAGLPPVRVAVNVSPPELRHRNFVQSVLEVVGSLQEHNGWGIDLEVTEGALFGDSASCIHALRLLRSAGLRIAIDDFGTGYSSLGRLSELPIDSLKIDKAFTSKLPDDRKTGKLVATIIELAHVFEMTTVAEGVETREQLDYLIECGCDESQGFLHSRPLASDAFEQVLRSGGGAIKRG